MDSLMFIKHRGVLGKARWLTGTGFLGLIAMVVLFAISNAQAAGIDQHQTRQLHDGGRHPAGGQRRPCGE